MYGKTKDNVGMAPLIDAERRLITGQGGKYKDQTLLGNQYFATSIDVEMSVYSATSNLGLIIYNPAGSGVNLVWNKWAVQIWATSADMDGIVLAVGTQPTAPIGLTVAPLTGGSLLRGSTSAENKNSVAKAYTIATIIAPVFVWPLVTNTVAINVIGTYMTQGDLDGAFASAPGTCTVIGGLTAAGVDVNSAIGWQEVPV